MSYDADNINLCPIFRADAGKVTSVEEARALIRKTVKVLFEAGKYSVTAKDSWIGLIPYASKNVSAWLRADAAPLGGTWVKPRVVLSGRGMFGRLGGSDRRSGYVAGYLKNNAR